MTELEELIAWMREMAEMYAHDRAANARERQKIDDECERWVAFVRALADKKGRERK